MGEGAGQGAEGAEPRRLVLAQGEGRVRIRHLAVEVDPGADGGGRDAVGDGVLVVALAEVTREVGADVPELLAVLQVSGALRGNPGDRNEAIKQERPRPARQPVRLLDARPDASLLHQVQLQQPQIAALQRILVG